MLPAGNEGSYPYDTTPFVQLSIHEVVKTLFEAIMLVFLVMYLFLENMRATLIPTIAVPVVLLGTFAILAAFGYSINTLTMFGMVLAIGLLVDDAIVVVENVERVMMEDKSPKEDDGKINVANSGRTGGYRDGAVSGIYSDGILRRFYWGNLSPVLYHHRFGNGAFCSVALILPLRYVQRCLNPSLLSITKIRAVSSAGLIPPSIIALTTTPTASAKSSVPQDDIYYLCADCCRNGGVVLRLPSSFLPEEDQVSF
ncbi:efflux RND transporter permease subunit [Escherichia coli]